MKPAVFLDRDGTLIEQVHHLSRVADVAVYPFAAEALRRVDRLGYDCVVVTNQSAVGRGLLDESELARIHEEMKRQLGTAGKLIRGIYYSTAVPVCGDPRIIEQHDRKPGPGMLLQAAADLGLDISRSWMVGDAISDVLAGRNAGCRGTILVCTGYGAGTESADSAIDYVANDLLAAAQWISESDVRNFWSTSSLGRAASNEEQRG